jgi:Ca2+-binding RTX toxin-like protein
VDAGPGDDLVWAGENDGSMDSIDCGAGADRAVANRSDRVFGCESVTRLRGQKVQGDVRLGDETANVLDDWTWRRADLILGFGGDDYLNGHSGADILWGNDEDDQLDGDHSPDLLLGGAGDDTLWGNSGNDRLWGGFGLDRLYGDWEADDPGDGGDEIFSIEADGEIDVIVCGLGIDRVVARPEDNVVKSGCERVIRIAR